MSEKVIIQCNQCSKRLRATPAAQSRRARCPGCQAILTIPGTASAPAPNPPAPTSAPNPTPARAAVVDPLAFDSLRDNPYSQSQPIQTTTPRSISPAPTVVEANLDVIPVWLMVALVCGCVAALALFASGAVALGHVLSSPVTSAASPTAPNVESVTMPTPALSTEPTRKVANTAPERVSNRSVASIPLDTDSVELPELGKVETTFPSGVTTHFVQLSGPNRTPAAQTQLRIYLPPGEHAKGSLPCVLVAPAGTRMIHGVDLERNTDYHDETLPYAEAGMVVIEYSLDGALSEAAERNELLLLSELETAFPQFIDTGGGVANGRMAIHYAMERLPMVDPKRMNCAGHSSAATVALLLAAEEPKIHRVAAFAAAYDLPDRLGEFAADPGIEQRLPGITSFIYKTSPLSVTKRIRCPVLVFHARDDNNVPIRDAERFIAILRKSNDDVETLIVNSGGHYSSMIEEGIPAAIKFFQK